MNEQLQKLIDTPIAYTGMRANVADRAEKERLRKLDAEGPLANPNIVHMPAWNPKAPITTDAVRAVLSEMGVSVRTNLITKRMEILGIDGRYSQENASELLPTLVRDYIVSAGGRVAIDTVARSLGAIADGGRYHPFIEMLGLAPWDGVDRLGEVYEILGIDAGTLDAVLVRKWLHQCVALAFNDWGKPYGADGVLTLYGRQGCGKTSFLRKLAHHPDWFLEGAAIDMTNKDSIIQATGAMICELGEVDGMLRKEQTQLKAFLTNPIDEYRAPYARTPTRHPRRTSFAATVNDRAFLTDSTGSRRFWVVPVEGVDLGRLDRLDILMLWRQIYEEYFLRDKQGFRLTPDERVQLEGRNRAFDRPLEFEEEIHSLLNWDLPLSEWRWVRAGDFRCRIDAANVNASKIGRVLAKIAANDSRAEVKRPNNVVRYFLPINF